MKRKKKRKLTTRKKASHEKLYWSDPWKYFLLELVKKPKNG